MFGIIITGIAFGLGLAAAAAEAGSVAGVASLSRLDETVDATSVRLSRLELEGVVVWSSAAEGRIILEDLSGIMQLELGLPCRIPAVGERILLEGEAIATRDRHLISLSAVPLVDNDGLHPRAEVTGTIRLSAGLHPIRLAWFNRTDKAYLDVEYASGRLDRQAVPSDVLFRVDSLSSDGRTNWVNGLDYRCCEGLWWSRLPALDHLPAAKEGSSDNFSTAAATRTEQVGMLFSGHIRIDEDDEYRFSTTSDDGSRLYIGRPSLRIRVLESSCPLTEVATRTPETPDFEPYWWTEIEGSVLAVNRLGNHVEIELSTNEGSVVLKIAEEPDPAHMVVENERIKTRGIARMLSRLDGTHAIGEVYVQRVADLERYTPHEERLQEGDVDVLKSAEAVNRLQAAELEQGKPVHLSGVVASVLHGDAFVLQDSTRGMYINAGKPLPLRVGDFCEVEGIASAGEFSPFISASRVERVGSGSMPVPVKAAWDQLLNGNLHCQYVEVEGVAVAIDAEKVSLLTREGTIEVRMNSMAAGLPDECLNALLRLRGCLFADWDDQAGRVKVGDIRLDQHLVHIVKPAPMDPFSVPEKGVDELLRFDPQAGALQRIKVAGRLVFRTEELCCVMDDSGMGMRFVPLDTVNASEGDRIEVVGFLDLDQPSPLLRAAMVRKVSRAGPFEPQTLVSGMLFRDDYDSCMVEVEGELLGVAEQQQGTMLEMRNGAHYFNAVIRNQDGQWQAPAIGSRLGLVGVYLGQGGSRMLGRPINSFRLMVKDGIDVRIISQPPWWTLRRLLTTVIVLLSILLAAFVWIKLLSRQVEERTRELGEQIRQRQRVEHEREIERERARLANDLHDDLGSSLTEVSLMTELLNDPDTSADEQKKCAEELNEISLQMVNSLEEIVWAVNPRNDNIVSLTGYFSLYARHMLELASVQCGLDIDEDLPDGPLDPGLRQGLFYAFKEAITNIVRHARASKAWVRITVQGESLGVEVSDDGCGIDSDRTEAGADGLANMRERMKALGGTCHIESKVGEGTTVWFSVPMGGNGES